MKSLKAKALYAMLASLVISGAASAADIVVNADITTSTTWTANNVYLLQTKVYVTNGATLTIQPGTKIKGTTDTGVVITRGSKINAVGTAANPIIFTSTLDPLDGTPRYSDNEWGNITILGKGYISASHKNSDGTSAQTYNETPDFPNGSPHTNSGTPDGTNKAVMEGLTADNSAGDPRVIYGGNDDNDNSGTLAYVSLRFGGHVLLPNVELNGLSLGAVGRNTDIHHIDIWCNKDDGVEIWGGTVGLKYLSIWNVGDDSFDVDQGWRGKAQFGLIVQGHSSNNAQGSGIGDNCIEVDGAERNDAQPVTTAAIYNFTAIGQPYNASLATGDQGIALRDEARVQFRNCIFMDLGENLIKEENSETNTTGWKYGNFSTLTYSSVWTTGYAESWNKGNPLTGGHANVGGAGSATYTTAFLQTMYQAQTSGSMLELKDSVFFNNGFPTAYTNANGSDAVGVTGAAGLTGGAAANNNVAATLTPVAEVYRDPAATVLLQGSTFVMKPVTRLDPRAANNAVTSVAAAPNDGFFTPAQYRGAFSKDVNWCIGWTAASQYGIFKNPDGTTQQANPTPAVTSVALASALSFVTEVGKTYTVESSTDGKKWALLSVLAGTGGIIDVTGLVGYDAAKVYRVSVQ